MLELILRFGDLSFVELLVKSGANTTLKDRCFLSPKTILTWTAYRNGLTPENLVPPAAKDGGVSRLEIKEGGRRALLAILRKKVSLG